MIQQFLHIYCSAMNSYSSASESNRQNPPYRTIDLPFFFRYKHLNFLKNVSSPDQARVSVRVSGQFCGYDCFELQVKRISLSAFANHFELTDAIVLQNLPLFNNIILPYDITTYHFERN